MTVSRIVETLKAGGEDFEWYPTTQKIVDCLAERIFTELDYRPGEFSCDYDSVLDIGCGNGSFFEKIDRTRPVRMNTEKGCGSRLYHRYGIERSPALCEQIPDSIVLLGSDFNEQTLIDKRVDLIFCNPPYSEYEAWAEKIVMQGNCTAIALVIPCRWKNSRRISYALKKRRMAAEILGSFDFLNAERRARAKVDLIFIGAEREEICGRSYENKIPDPFDVWFDDTFKISASKEKVYDFESEESKKAELVERRRLAVHQAGA